MKVLIISKSHEMANLMFHKYDSIKEARKLGLYVSDDHFILDMYKDEDLVIEHNVDVEIQNIRVHFESNRRVFCSNPEWISANKVLQSDRWRITDKVQIV